MPQQNIPTVENNFTKGLITEFTGMNFPENAATDTDNCVYTLVGDTTRRGGFNYEENFSLNTINRTNSAINTYKWNNVGGDGLTQIIVQQTGDTVYFYKTSAATIVAPLSTQILVSTISVSSFVGLGATFDATIECQFSDGNGYLFVYHPDCDPFFCSYSSGTITASTINVQIRDFTGVNEPGVPVNQRPSTLTNEHLYNLTNQGWTQGNTWITDTARSITPGTGSFTFTDVGSGLSVTLGDFVNITNQSAQTPGGLPVVPVGSIIMSGSVTAYSGTSITINVIAFTTALGGSATSSNLTIAPTNHGYINGWFAAESNYPSNGDVWWYFKDTTDTFNPAVTQPQVTLNTGQAPQGHFVCSAFNQNRSLLSGISGLTPVSTVSRPRTGTWFQGRVWYAGVDAQQVASGDATYYTWTENLYFSQIVSQSTDFGNCYQTNDPTSENLFDLLPTDGGVIQIQGAGSIYKLFPIQNGMLVFAANGVWFITGNQGIGFSADDYTITKISAVQSISGTSFIDVNGLPLFWNEEGIYAVNPSSGGGLTVEPLTVGTILTFYNSIPMQSKKFARGAYHPIDYTVQWCYKSENETSVTNRYDFDSVLCFNTYNKAFYPYSLPDVTGQPHIHGINYVAGPGGTTSPDPVFKYLTASSNGSGSYNFTFSEENDYTNYVDFISYDGTGFNFTSYFVTGYRLHGQGQRRFQIPYIYMYSRNDTPTSYYIQGLWDFATSRNSGRWSTAQRIVNGQSNFGTIFRRHKLRGQGVVLQIKVLSVDGQPFDVIGWSTFETQNTGV